MVSLSQLWADLLGLFFPHICPACGEAGLPPEAILCLDCQVQLPLTGYHRFTDNPFTERFWGRLPVQSGAAMLHFNKGGRVQRLMHQLKYKDRPDVGQYLGKVFGATLRQAPAFEGVELILPVPLHERRLRQRGYNQSAAFAEGLAQAWGVPFDDKALRRTQHTETQTHKSRMERFDNVSAAFAVAQAETLQGKHLLLVDDVLTTGATLEACGLKLLEIPGTRLSLATIAIADH